MPKLTDAQLVILSAAAQREDGAVLPLPKSLKIKGSAATRTLGALRKKGLLEEQSARPGTEVRHEHRRMVLIISDMGLRAIDGGPGGVTDKKTVEKKRQAKTCIGGTDRKPSAAKPKATLSQPAVRQGTKQALLIGLLKRKRGATIDEAVAATGWQPHSVRGAISGTLKKKLDLTVTSERTDGRGRIYRIEAAGK